jgi:hypothetical protein
MSPCYINYESELRVPVSFWEIKVCSCVICEILAHSVNNFTQNGISQEMILDKTDKTGGFLH